MSVSKPAQAGKKDSHSAHVQQWIAALDGMMQALKLLDESDAPPEIGAELDLAIEHRHILRRHRAHLRAPSLPAMPDGKK